MAGSYIRDLSVLEINGHEWYIYGGRYECRASCRFVQGCEGCSMGMVRLQRAMTIDTAEKRTVSEKSY